MTPSTFLGPTSTGSGSCTGGSGGSIGEIESVSSTSVSGMDSGSLSGEGGSWKIAVLSGEDSTGSLGNRTVSSSVSSSCCGFAAGVDTDLPNDVVELRNMLAREKIVLGSASSSRRLRLEPAAGARGVPRSLSGLKRFKVG